MGLHIVKIIYALHMTVYGLGNFFPILILCDTYFQGLIDKGVDAEKVNIMKETYSDPVIVLTVVLTLCVSSVIGMIIGYLMLKKQFAPAGVADEANQ